MKKLNKLGETLQAVDARSERVKAVEQELGLPQLEPELRALYRAVFKKIQSPAAPAEPVEAAPMQPVNPPSGV